MKLLLSLVVLTVTAATARADLSIVDNDKTISVDCAKDKTVTLIGNHITVTLVGTCTKVTVMGNHEIVKGSARQFFVAGNHNTVHADAVDELHIAGTKNTVSWKTGITAKTPKIANPGKDNKVTQEK